MATLANDQYYPLLPLSSASTDGHPHPTSLTDTLLLMSVLEGRLGLSASVLSPEQRKLLHVQMKIFMADHAVGISYRARNTIISESDIKMNIVKLKYVDSVSPVMTAMLDEGSVLEMLFETREMTKEIPGEWVV